MADLLDAFKEKAEDLASTINRKGGIRGTIDSLRQQMAEADRRRAVRNVKLELKRLERQINEMITAVGIQAVGLHQAGRLSSPELQPLCQHIIELKAELTQQEGELAKLEAVEAPAPAAQTASQAGFCASCGKPLPEGATFCPYCGKAVPVLVTPQAPPTCSNCGAELRPGSKFCPKCGQAAPSP